MPLALIRHGNTTAPVLTCDVCGHPIDRIADAAILWNPDDLTDGEPTPAALIVHTPTCAQAAEARAGTPLYSTDGALALYQLVRNLGMRPRDLERQAELHRALASL